jgi:hypothetical protein
MRQRAEGDNKCKQDEMSPAGIVRRTFDARCQRDRQKDQQRVGAQFRPVIDELPPECDEDARESRGPWADHGARVDDDRCGGNRCEGDGEKANLLHRDAERVKEPADLVPNWWSRFTARDFECDVEGRGLDDDLGRCHLVLPHGIAEGARQGCRQGDKRRRKRHKGDDPCVAEVPETRWLV